MRATAALAVVVAVSPAMGGDSGARPVAPAKPAAPAPAGPPAPTRTFAFNVPGLNGGKISNDAYNGKILVVDVWATWCGPCRLVIPSLIELSRKYKSRGVEVVGLSVDEPAADGKGYEHVKSFTKQFGMSYPIGILTDDAYLELSKVMGFDARSGFSIPTTILLARDGAVLKLYPGYFPGQEKELERIIDHALASETPPAKTP